MRLFIYFGCVIFLLAGLSSCTMEKRHYRNGYYFDRGDRDRNVNATVHEAQATPEAVDANVIVTVDSNSSKTIATVNDSTQYDSIVKPTQFEREVEIAKERIYQKLPAKVQSAAAPLEKDKKQATGAGIAAAIFFILGMVGLIIKGTAPPVGIFIGAAFVCFLLCVILASFLYPREPAVKQPKEQTAGADKAIVSIGVGVMVIAATIVLLAAALWLSIFTSLFF